MRFRLQYGDPDEDELLGQVSAVSFDPEEDRTEQHHKDECDIPLMLKRLGVSPEKGLPVVTVSNIIKDVTLLPDTLAEAFDIMERGQEAFASLPAKVREYFLNDPRRFVMASPEEMIKAGIPAEEKGASAPVEEPAGDALAQ